MGFGGDDAARRVAGARGGDGVLITSNNPANDTVTPVPAGYETYGVDEIHAAYGDDLPGRLAIAPLTHEARGLDVTPGLIAKLQSAGDGESARILGIIYRDEIGHVAIGNHWYRWLCEREGLDPVAHYGVLVERYQAPRLYPPFNAAARRRAGFTDEELAWLLA